MNDASKEQISRELYEKGRSQMGNTTASAQGGDSDDEDINGYDSIASGLPPASSDRRKWWLDKGMVVSGCLLST